MSDGWIGLALGALLGIHAGVFITIAAIAWPPGGSWRSLLPGRDKMILKSFDMI